MNTIQIPDEYRYLQVAGYLIAVNLPSGVRPPRIKGDSVPVERFDIIGYVGTFPDPLQGRYLHALKEGDKGVFYIRELTKDSTRFAPRAYEYSLGIPTPEGQRNVTGLEPVYNIEAQRTPIFVGRPEAKAVRGTAFQTATYIIRPREIAGRRAYEILCVRTQYAREVAKGVARGIYDELLTYLYRQTTPIGWETTAPDFTSWYNVITANR